MKFVCGLWILCVCSLQERGLEPLKPGEQRIGKSRYSSVDCFISQCDLMKDKFNDVLLPINDQAFKELRHAGIDERLAVS